MLSCLLGVVAAWRSRLRSMRAILQRQEMMRTARTQSGVRKLPGDRQPVVLRGFHIPCQRGVHSTTRKCHSEQLVPQLASHASKEHASFGVAHFFDGEDGSTLKFEGERHCSVLPDNRLPAGTGCVFRALIGPRWIPHPDWHGRENKL